MRVIIASVPANAARTKRLVDHCLKLDGTKVDIVQVDDSKFTPKYPANELASRQSYSLRCAAVEANGEPFIWLEQDSIPLRAGWKAELEKDHAKYRKPYTLSASVGFPHDLVGGIGIYGPDTATEIPPDFESHGWDLWMTHTLRHKINFTNLIQHSYGHYKGGQAWPYYFPRDTPLLREDACIFHKDGYQTLLGGNQSWAATGDCGDIIALLPAIRQMGGGTLRITDRHDLPFGLRPRADMKGERYNFMEPLLKSCPYLHGVEFSYERGDVTGDATEFRRRQPAARATSLAHWQAGHMGIDRITTFPWLEVTPNPKTAGRTIVGRSPRYQGKVMPWRNIAARLRHKMLFIGLADEHKAFEKTVGMRVERLPIANALQMAEAVAGAERTIVNQTLLWWVAFALGKPTIQEVYEAEPNSMIQRPIAQYITQNNPSVKW